ncbi:hypothetical protein WT21_12000 [Burkholderia territorii]|uniref:DUF2950 domain-containing protein n=1 Tax=Burkholderia territorii TaxID=1503055 RepID=UPI00075233CE|nr:DUF2950 domain-containing protein [Burkholderia territorii]KVL25566.1 hypothetical protein WS97_30180 [Burkholderia territorii]KVQ50245.1 hypothetical protein WT21_12000 [Burkholderia territorii]KVT77109.1 hypothetical protein WT25_23485 [Burkholderia territorii]
MNLSMLFAARTHADYASNRRARRLFAIPALLLSMHSVHAQTIFPTPDAAAQAFVDAVATNDSDALHRILGPNARSINTAGGFDPNDIDQFLAAWSKGHRIDAPSAAGGDARTAHLLVGDSDWPLPIPIMRTKAGWHFDVNGARDEILTRRIGRNENAAILTSLAYVDAQRDYHDITGRYATRLVSTPGQRDGLYWPARPGEPQSPLGPLAQVMGNQTAANEAYHGYHYRILTAQGKHAPDGQRDYRANGMLATGFGLVAWPATYGQTGMATFIVNADGQVYEKNLGPRTSKLVESIRTYDPDPSWHAVTMSP